MIQIPLQVRAADVSVPPFSTQGVVQHPESPLAVTQRATYDPAAREWRNVEPERFVVTHRPSGFALPGDDFPTVGTAFVKLCAVEAFPAWLFASGKEGCAATAACRAMWRATRGA